MANLPSRRITPAPFRIIRSGSLSRFLSHDVAFRRAWNWRLFDGRPCHGPPSAPLPRMRRNTTRKTAPPPSLKRCLSKQKKEAFRIRAPLPHAPGRQASAVVLVRFPLLFLLPDVTGTSAGLVSFCLGLPIGRQLLTAAHGRFLNLPPPGRFAMTLQQSAFQLAPGAEPLYVRFN